MLVYFDIDSTVFTTHLFKKTRVNPQLVELLGVSLEKLTEVDTRYFGSLEKGTDFNYHEYTAFLFDAFSTVGGVASAAELEALFENPVMYEGMIYPDVLPVLQELKQLGHTLGVYSEGFEDFQRHKLVHTGILPFFDQDRIHISRRKKSPEVIAQLDVNSIVVDDKLEYLVELPKGMTPLMIQREPDATPVPVQKIQSLEEIVRFLK